MLTGRSVERKPPGAAFTLIELLVVITIVIFLIAMLSRVFMGARQRAYAATARQSMKNITIALKSYEAAVSFLPGYDDPPGTDSAAKLYRAICEPPPQKGGGGAPGGPFYEASREEIGVPAGPDLYRPATNAELDDREVTKYILDPWGRPFHYVENASKPDKTADMHNRYSFDMWSDGPDLENDQGEDDDVTNWEE